MAEDKRTLFGDIKKNIFDVGLKGDITKGDKSRYNIKEDLRNTKVFFQIYNIKYLLFMNKSIKILVLILPVLFLSSFETTRDIDFDSIKLADEQASKETKICIKE